MGTLEITIRPRAGQRWPVVAEHTPHDSPLAHRDEGSLELDRAQLKQLLPNPRAYGAAMGAALFSGPIGRALDQAIGRAGPNPLRLLLYIEDQELRSERWERLCVPVNGGWEPLATYQRVPFSRYLPSHADRHFLPISRADLKALVVAASPSRLHEWGLTPFDEEAAVRGVLARLAEAQIPATLLATRVAGACAPPSLDEIVARLSAEQYTLLHIVCHGRSVEYEGAVSYLCRPDNPDAVDPVTAPRLIDRLNNLRDASGLPHLIFLSSCESASDSNDGALGSLAQQLVERLGIPVVVAMADKVSITTANTLSAAFYTSLAAHGEADLALVQATVRVTEQDDVTVPVIFSRLGGRPLFTRVSQREPTAEDIERGLGRLAELVAQRAPVLLPDLETAARTLRGGLRLELAQLSAEAQASLDQARRAVEEICLEATELSFAALATGAEPPPYEGQICPFPGLTPFSEEQRRFFFGREELTSALVEQLERSRFLVISGPSGSGKSSLLLAGIVPALKQRRPGLSVAWFTPGSMPLAELERAIYEQEQADASEILLVIDQFEELFTLCTDEENERRPFIAELHRLQHQHQIIIGVHRDFLDNCAAYPALNSLIDGNHIPIQPLSAEELRAVAERQAAAVGLRFEAGLLGVLRRDLSDASSAMPLAQHALRELWQRRRGRWLRAHDYDELGGIRRAITHSADEIYRSLDEAGRRQMHDIFVRLTRIDRGTQPDPGADWRDTRQRVRFDELIPADETGQPDEAARQAIAALIEELSERGLVVRNGGLVEVAHQALIRSWERLRRWLDDERQLLVQLDELRQAATDWADNQGKEGFLWAGSRLSQAEALAELGRFRLNAGERRFLLACAEARRQAAEAQARQLAREQELRQAAEQALVRAEENRRLAERLQAEAEAQAENARLRREEALEQKGRAEEARQQAEQARSLAERNEQRARRIARRLSIATIALIGLAGVALALMVIAFDQRAAVLRQRDLDNARAALQRGQPDTALETANRYADDAEAAYLLAEAADRSARRVHSILSDFNDPVRVVSYSPNGASYLAGSASGKLRIWERASGRLLRSYEREDSISAAAFAPGADIVVIGSFTGELVALGAAADTPFTSADGGEIRAGGEILSLAFSPDGALLLSGDAEGNLQLWDPQAHTLRATLLEVPDRISGVAFVEQGRIAVAATEAGQVYLFDTANWEELQGFELRDPDGPDSDGDLLPDVCLITSLAVLPSPDGEQLLAGCEDTSIQRWSLGGAPIQWYQSHDAKVISLAASADGARFASSSYDQSILLWDVAYGAPIHSFSGHDAEANSLALSPDGTALLTGSYDGTVRLWDTSSLQLERSLAQAGDGQLGQVITLRPDSDSLLAVDQAGGVIRWGLADGTPLNEQKLPGRLLALSGDGQRALLQLPEGLVAFWDLEANTMISSFEAEPLPPEQANDPPGRTPAALSADGSLALLTLSSGDTELRAAEDGRLLHRFGPEDSEVSALAISPDSSQALFGYANHTIGLWNLSDGHLVRWLNGHIDIITAVAFSPDGTRAISGSWDRTARIWDLANGESLITLEGHTRALRAVALSDTLALTGSDDRSARLWDAASGRELAAYEEHFASVNAVAISHDGRSAFTATTNGEVARWHSLTGSELLNWVQKNRPVAP